METLAVCAKVLYDNDILEKQNELDRYKKDMMPPIILFNSEEELCAKKDILYTHLEKNIVSWFNEHFCDSLEYSYGALSEQLTDYSNTHCFQSHLYARIFDALQPFFGDTNWLSDVVNMMCIGLEATLTSIAKMSQLAVIHRNNFCIIIEASIQSQLDSLVFNYHQDKYFKFKCHTCSKHVSWLHIDKNTCVECIQKKNIIL